MKNSLLYFYLFVTGLSCWGAEFSVRVAGLDVPVIEHRVRDRLNCPYAHFTASGAVPVEVRAAAGVDGWSLSPAHHRLAASADGDFLRFTLPSPLYLVLTVNGTRLLLLADPPEEPLPAEKVIDVTDAPYSADATGAHDARPVCSVLSTRRGRRAAGRQFTFLRDSTPRPACGCGATPMCICPLARCFRKDHVLYIPVGINPGRRQAGDPLTTHEDIGDP